MNEWTMEQKEWAKREIDLCLNDPEGEKELRPLIKKIYEEAYNSYCYLIDQLKDEDKPDFVKMILKSLMSGYPLTPIIEDEEYWTQVCGIDTSADLNVNTSEFYCTRYPSLHKFVNLKDNTKKYIDYNQFTCVDIHSNNTYIGGIACSVLRDTLPITMPYNPESSKIRIYTEDFLYDSENGGDFDTVGVLCYKTTMGQVIPVKRYFKETNDGFVEIDQKEYIERRKDSKINGKEDK